MALVMHLVYTYAPVHMEFVLKMYLTFTIEIFLQELFSEFSRIFKMNTLFVFSSIYLLEFTLLTGYILILTKIEVMSSPGGLHLFWPSATVH